MKNILRVSISLCSVVLVLSTLLCSAACNEETVPDETSEKMTEQVTDTNAEHEAFTELNYDGIDISKHVKEVKYKELEITLKKADDSREEALWEAILATANVESYPEDKVEYFFKQTKDAYMYLVNGNEEDYLLLLKNRGTDENKMRDEARELVKKDLIYYYIVQTEKIAVTDKEKTELFDKYVEKYVSAYGYNREYVKDNMTEMIYDSMLYDKTMEFLIKENNFSVDTDTQNTEKTEKPS